MTSPRLATSPARRIALAGAAGAFALALASCGTPSDQTTTAVPAAGGVVPAAVTTPSPGAAVDTRSLVMQIGMAASAAKTVHIDGTAGGKPVSGSASYVGGVVRSDVVIGKTHVVTIDHTVYTKTGSGAWSKKNAQPAAAPGLDPRGLLGKLGTTVRNLGSTTVDGTTATHYQSKVTIAQAQAAADSARARAALEKLAGKGVTGYTADLYVGPGSLPVKATVDVEGAPAGRGDVAVTFSKWGAPTTITAPHTG